MDRRALLAMTGEVGRGGAYVWSLRAKRDNPSFSGIKTAPALVIASEARQFICFRHQNLFMPNIIGHHQLLFL